MLAHVSREFEGLGVRFELLCTQEADIHPVFSGQTVWGLFLEHKVIERERTSCNYIPSKTLMNAGAGLIERT